MSFRVDLKPPPLLKSEQNQVPSPIRSTDSEFALPPLHAGQVAAYWALQQHRLKVLRCGRRFGKTEFAKTWIVQGLLQGYECAWLAPQHMIWSEVYTDLAGLLRPPGLLDSGKHNRGPRPPLSSYRHRRGRFCQGRRQQGRRLDDGVVREV